MPPCGERLRQRCHHACRGGFNPRPPAESDSALRSDRACRRCFNPPPPCGERPNPALHSRPAGVSIRAPLRRATRALPDRRGIARVSIRAPLRRATRALPDRRGIARVSIRAPLRRATSIRLTKPRLLSMFQSAPPCGERPAQRDIPVRVLPVSIRAPLRRATRIAVVQPQRAIVSIRPPLRRATLRSHRLRGVVGFQSAPPCGAMAFG